jgi:hypothetical protein
MNKATTTPAKKLNPKEVKLNGRLEYEFISKKHGTSQVPQGQGTTVNPFAE